MMREQKTCHAAQATPAVYEQRHAYWSQIVSEARPVPQCACGTVATDGEVRWQVQAHQVRERMHGVLVPVLVPLLSKRETPQTRALSQ